MIFYQIIFGTFEKDCYEDAKILAEEYLGCLLKNGQIDVDYNYVPWQGQIVAYVESQGHFPDRLKHHSSYGKKALRELVQYFGQKPIWTIHEDFPTTRKSTWKKAPFLYLCTDMFDHDSPLRRGDNGTLISLYTISITDQERESLYFWIRRCRAFDEIWIGSSDLEMQAYKVLAEPTSSLSQCGRESCLAIERATKIPTYYWLNRYFGRQTDDEKERKCPGCGRSWFVENFNDLIFWHFDFKCDDCRLVSHMACGDVNLRYATIGEPSKKTKVQKKKKP